MMPFQSEVLPSRMVLLKRPDQRGPRRFLRTGAIVPLGKLMLEVVHELADVAHLFGLELAFGCFGVDPILAVMIGFVGALGTGTL